MRRNNKTFVMRYLKTIRHGKVQVPVDMAFRPMGDRLGL